MGGTFDEDELYLRISVAIIPYGRMIPLDSSHGLMVFVAGIRSRNERFERNDVERIRRALCNLFSA